jgi:type 2 lantibiotic biosynthesis protein LanM
MPRGALSTRRYRDFVDQLLRDGLLTIWASYPVLARLVSRMVERWMESSAESYRRLAADLPLLARSFGDMPAATSLGRVVDLEAGLSDPHGGGRSVCVFVFESGLRLVYKPKDVGLEAAHVRLLAWCLQRGATAPTKLQQVVERPGYGWVEYVEHRPCADRAEVQRFYQRAGGLLCLLYALGATDCHAENLVACGPNPVLVDMETLMHPDATPIDERSGSFDSVLRTGLLPRWDCQQETRYVVDMSGLGFVGSPSVHEKLWRLVNTDHMHVVWERLHIPTPKNTPLLEGVVQTPESHLDELVGGFEQMYRFLLVHRSSLAASDGPLREFGKHKARFIFRATKIYQRIAEAALMPEHLSCGVDWSIELDRLAFTFLIAEERPGAWPILEAELRSLEQLDIPLFLSDGAKVVASELAQPLDKYLKGSGFDEMLRRFERLSEADLARQSEIIRSTLFTRVAEIHPRDGIVIGKTSSARRNDETEQTPVLPAATFLDEALAIGQSLKLRAVEVAPGRYNWVGLTYILNTERFQVNLLSTNAYDGTAGVAMFLAALDNVTGRRDYRDLALGALEPVRSTFRARSSDGTRRLIARLGLGGTFGFGSVLYALVRTGAFLCDASLADDAVRGLGALSLDAIQADRQLDVVAGAAGSILALIGVHNVTWEHLALELAEACGSHLLGSQIPTGEHRGAWPNPQGGIPLPGFSHGAAGIAYALMLLSAATGNEAYAAAAERAFAFERRCYTPPGEDTPRFDRGPGHSGEATMVSWCHGAPGIALGRLGSLLIAPSKSIRRDAEQAIAITVAHGAAGLDHLCCGGFGRIEALLVGGRVLRRPELERAALAQASTAVTRARQTGGYRLRSQLADGRAIFNPALFQGMAGIGYQLLRLIRPRTLPSMLLLE